MPTDQHNAPDHGGSDRIRRVAASICLLTAAVEGIIAAGRFSSDDGGSTPSEAAAGTPMSVGAPTTVATDGSAGSTPTSEESAPVRRWPREIASRPAVFGPRGEPAPDRVDEGNRGLHLWSDFDGWHLWSVGSDRPGRTIVVEVDGDIPIESIRSFGDITFELADPKRLVIVLGDDPDGIRGVRLNPGFFTGSVTVGADPTDPADPPLIRLGSGSVPVEMPVTLRKGEPLATG